MDPEWTPNGPPLGTLLLSSTVSGLSEQGYSSAGPQPETELEFAALRTPQIHETTDEKHRFFNGFAIFNKIAAHATMKRPGALKMEVPGTPNASPGEQNDSESPEMELKRTFRTFLRASGTARGHLWGV